jgi:hypothetical protein
MPKLKVKRLEWYMNMDPQKLLDQGYTPVNHDAMLLGRDGYYCYGDTVWFEVGGVGYNAYPGTDRRRAREYFCYDFTVNNEAILPRREAEALRTVLKTSRDSSVRKAIIPRLRLHEQAVYLRDTGRNALLIRRRRRRIIGR